MSRSPSSDNGPSGIVLLDKPAGESSRKAAGRAARELGATKFGHAGTLDPFATGLLVVLLGRACRTQDWFTKLPKGYVAHARLGWTSTTGDPEGELTETGRVPPLPLRLPTGTIQQRPPAFSAVHVDGSRAYQLARRGEEVDLPPREVTIYECTDCGTEDGLAVIQILCSSGTYVRSIVSELGDAYTERLRRTSVGPFRLEEADPGRIVPIAEGLSFLRSAELDDEEARRAGHGQAIDMPGSICPPRWQGPGETPPEILLTSEGSAVALARTGGEPAELLKPVVGFTG